MKVETLIKLGAVGAAVAATAAGSFVLTAKAVKKLENETFPENPTDMGVNPQDNPAADKLLGGSLEKTNESFAAAPNNRESFKTDFKYVPPMEEKATAISQDPSVVDVAPEIIKEEAPVVEKKEAPFVAPIPEPIPVVPVAAPIPEPIPVAPVAAPIPEPVVIEESPKQEEDKYTDIPMDLPYIAGKLDLNESEPTVEPTVEAPVEPNVVMSGAEVIDSHPDAEMLPGMEETKPETFADINPLEQGFTVGMTDMDGANLPTSGEMSAPETFADILPVAEDTEAKAEEPVIEPAVEPTVEAAPVEPAIEPAVEATAPIEPAVEAPVAEPVDESTVHIGAAVVSDNANNTEIKKVVETFGVKADNLVSIVAEQAMVFEFLYPDMRNDATLVNVYFVLPDGQVTLPPEQDKENVLAFGRNFITENEEFKKFLLK